MGHKNNKTINWLLMRQDTKGTVRKLSKAIENGAKSNKLSMNVALYSCRNSHEITKILKLLLKNKAKPNEHSIDLALEFCKDSSDIINILKLLVKNKAKPSEFSMNLALEFYEDSLEITNVLRLLVEKGVEVTSEQLKNDSVKKALISIAYDHVVSEVLLDQIIPCSDVNKPVIMPFSKGNFHPRIKPIIEEGIKKMRGKMREVKENKMKKLGESKEHPKPAPSFVKQDKQK